MNQETNLVELIYEFNAIATAETPSVSILQDHALKIADFFFQKPKTNAKFLVKKSSILRIFIDTFRVLKNFDIQQDLIRLIYQVTISKFGAKRLVENSATEAIFESITLFPNAIPDNFTIHFVILAKLSEKDAKFSTKFRCFHLTPFLLDNLRFFANDFDRALPVITVFHRCAISPTTCTVFRKHFSMRILLSYLSNACLPLHPSISMCIDSIRLLVKNKGIVLVDSWLNLVRELVKFYSFLMFDFENFKEIFSVLELFKEISRNLRGHAAIINSNLFQTLRDTIAKFQWVTAHTELKDRFIKSNMEIVQDFVQKKNIFYSPHFSDINDGYRNQVSLQNQVSPLNGKNRSVINRLNLFSEEFEMSKLRNFSLTIRSLIDIDDLSMYCYNSCVSFDAPTYLAEFFNKQKPDHLIIDAKFTKFHENLHTTSKFFAFPNRSYNKSPVFHTFLSPTICKERTQLYQKDDNTMLSMVLSKLDFINQPIYSIEKEVFRQKITFTDPILLKQKYFGKDIWFQSPSNSLNINKSLIFAADFESTNLQRILETNPNTYDVILRPDTSRHVQWFFFKVLNMDSDTKYIFNIVNFDKNSSQFSTGMQPLLFSRKSNRNNGESWHRVGSMIYYGDSDYTKRTDSSSTTGKLYSLTFSIIFPFDNDECYIAYHFPYTYTNLQVDMINWSNSPLENMYLRIDTLCDTYSGIPCPLVTITDLGANFAKEYIILSARVHPGETNASWMIKSIIEMLLTDDEIAVELRSKFVFKIVPMLNPDGVIYGNTRCNLLGFDLNRQWHDPSPHIHPTIYHTKALIKQLIRFGRQPLYFVDFHGHSLKKNIFMYGCNSLSKVEEVLPNIFAENYTGFDLQSSSNAIEKSKLRCGRVVVGTNLNIPCSYTLESTFCGFNQGEKKDSQINLEDFREISLKFLESLLKASQVVSDGNFKNILLQNSCSDS